MTVFLSFSVTTSMIAGTKVRAPFSDYPILYGSAKLQPQLRNKIEKTVVGVMLVCKSHLEVFLWKNTKPSFAMASHSYSDASVHFILTGVGHFKLQSVLFTMYRNNPARKVCYI